MKYILTAISATFLATAIALMCIAAIKAVGVHNTKYDASSDGVSRCLKDGDLAFQYVIASFVSLGIAGAFSNAYLLIFDGKTP